MNLKHRISVIDNAIIRLRSERNQYAATNHMQWPKLTDGVKKQAKEALRQAGIEEGLIMQIDQVAFQRSGHTLFGGSIKANNDACIEACQAGVDAIISMLNDCREMLKEKQGNRMMWWTLIFSAIAAFGAILSIFF